MATQVQWRGGSTAEHATFTGAAREITVDTQKQTLVLHDGSTAGGRPLLREDGSNAALSLGSAGTPSLKFTGDTNTGIYSPGSDQVAVSTGGTGRLFVDASGNVQIGSSFAGFGNGSGVEIAKSTTSTLRLTGNSGVGCEFFNTGSLASIQTRSAIPFTIQTNELERLRVTSAGLVGIGTSSVASTLHIVDSSSAANGTIRLGGGSAFSGYNSTIQQDGQTTGKLLFNSAATAGTGHGHQFQVDGTAAVTIDSSGRVGIGTPSPSQQLDIYSSQFAGLGFKSARTGSAENIGGPVWRDSTDTAKAGIQCTVDGQLKFGTGDNTERLRIDSSGRLLVGTSSAYFAAGSAITAPLIQTHGTNANLAQLLIGSWTSGNNAAASITLARSESGTIGNFGSALSSTDDVLGNVRFNGSDGTKFVEGANISAVVDGTWGTDDAPTRLMFSTTADGASSPTERMRISNGGYASFNTTSVIGSSRVSIAQDFVTGNGLGLKNTGAQTGGQYFVLFYNSSDVIAGSISHSGSTSVSYNTSSDYRLKENVTPVFDGITRLQQLKPSRFNFIADPDTVVDGFLAHEVQTIVPEAITGEKDAVDDEGNPEYQGIDQSKLVPLLTAALQEAIAKIEVLEQRLNDAGIN